MDIVLIAPQEILLRDKSLFRDQNIKSDFDNITINPVSFAYVKFLKDNLGIAALSSFLKENGCSVKVINTYLKNISIQCLCDDILDLNPSVIGISLLYDLCSYSTCLIVKTLRNKGYKGHITLGGPFSSVTYEYFLKGIKEINSVIRGEGEIPLLELIRKINKKEEWRDIKGLSYSNSDGEIIFNEFGEIIENLSVLPYPSRDDYRFLVNELKKINVKMNVASIYTSRGCLGKCTYCSAPELAKINSIKWRCRTVESIVDEIKQLVEEFNVKYINIIDENFYGYGQDANSRLKELARRIISLNLNIKFWAEIRVDIKFDDETFMLLKKAGFQDILLGLESGSQKTLNRWRKGTTIAQNEYAINKIREYGFKLEPSMIMVDPYTTYEEFKDTIEFIERNKLFNTEHPLNLINEMIVFTGTELERQLIIDGILKPIDVTSININNCAAIHTFCKKISTREYEIQSNLVRVMWKSLISKTNVLAELLDNKLPRIIGEIYHILKKSNCDKEGFKLILHNVGLWRKNIGLLLMDLLNELINIEEINSDIDLFEKNLLKRLDTVVEKYDKKYLDMNISDLLIKLDNLKTERM